MVFDPDEFGNDDPDDLNGGSRAPRRFIGWQTFFDFGDDEVRPNKLIDTKISTPLFQLPVAAIGTPRGEEVGPTSLAQRNLLRAITWEIPSGQRIAARMGAPVLAAGDLADVAALGFGDNTPLWVYILREAEVMAEGLHLGPVGGRIVAEVFLGLLEEDDASYLAAEPGWQPTLPAADASAGYRMTDLLTAGRRRPRRSGAVARSVLRSAASSERENGLVLSRRLVSAHAGMAALALVLLAAGCSNDTGSESTAADSDGDGQGWLLVLTGSTGTASDEGMTLTLDDGATVTMFTDRPARSVGVAPVESLVASWEEEYAGDPPNASLVATTDDGSSVSGVTLDAPELVDGELRLSFESLGAIEPPGEFGSFSLFIDMIDPEFGLRPPLNSPIDLASGATYSFSILADSFDIENVGNPLLDVDGNALFPGDTVELTDASGRTITIENPSEVTGQFEIVPN